MNIAFINGYVGRDPEQRTTQSGHNLTTFSVATETYSGGEKVTMWERVTVWGKLADVIGRYVQKGTYIVVCGERRENRWTDKDGNERVAYPITAWKVDFRGSKAQGGNGGGGRRPEQRQNQPAAQPPSDPAWGDDDIPF